MTRAHGTVVAIAVASIAFVGCGRAASAADAFYSPTIKGIDAVCDAYRPHAKREDVVRLARVGGIDAPWMVSDEATIVRVRTAPSFVAGDFATVVLDRGAIVAADLSHVDGPTGRVVLHAWCFIGGKLSRGTAEVATTYDRSAGYRRTAYYGDDLTQPLAGMTSEENVSGKAFVAPPKDVDALLVPEPDARPENLPFYDAFERERKGGLATLK